MEVGGRTKASSAACEDFVLFFCCEGLHKIMRFSVSPVVVVKAGVKQGKKCSLWYSFLTKGYTSSQHRLRYFFFPYPLARNAPDMPWSIEERF